MSKEERDDTKKSDKSEVYLNSITNASLSMHSIYNDSLDPVAVFDLLSKQNKRLVDDNNMKGVETMLAMQAKVLDALFHRMIDRAMNTEYIESMQIHMNLALKAQKQARQTLSTLSELKIPKQTAFVKQQNIAVNQQVNNIEQEAKNLENPTNELLRDIAYEGMDTRGASKAVTID